MRIIKFAKSHFDVLLPVVIILFFTYMTLTGRLQKWPLPEHAFESQAITDMMFGR